MLDGCTPFPPEFAIGNKAHNANILGLIYAAVVRHQSADRLNRFAAQRQISRSTTSISHLIARGLVYFEARISGDGALAVIVVTRLKPASLSQLRYSFIV